MSGSGHACGRMIQPSVPAHHTSLLRHRAKNEI
eukprot:CAMPEP_0170646964 /NCGR_PEP_ID=MMETSP0224-20130122/43929_1 /TAXON_ID=285029 /ORGANISM="Togula jolla, Strain CCCM 725" /LENGTH=32 /DNA_ID= /DNA_START= /DNA_END= /DNA_ORIENTATION=